MNKKKDALTFLTEAELQRIKAYITEAEKKTTGEIKVAIVSASGILPHFRKADKERTVIRRAKTEFRRLGINKTKESTGILILISLEERMVRVQPDVGIDRLIHQNTWNTLVCCITEAFKNGQPVMGICNAVSKIGEILSMHFPAEGKIHNQLSDDVVLKGRW